jgi:hypothetical protein
MKSQRVKLHTTEDVITWAKSESASRFMSKWKLDKQFHEPKYILKEVGNDWNWNRIYLSESLFKALAGKWKRGGYAGKTFLGQRDAIGILALLDKDSVEDCKRLHKSKVIEWETQTENNRRSTIRMEAKHLVSTYGEEYLDRTFRDVIEMPDLDMQTEMERRLK